MSLNAYRVATMRSAARDADRLDLPEGRAMTEERARNLALLAARREAKTARKAHSVKMHAAKAAHREERLAGYAARVASHRVSEVRGVTLEADVPRRLNRAVAESGPIAQRAAIVAAYRTGEKLTRPASARTAHHRGDK